ncbi:hypothetical protein PHMEG_00021144 [Phytophthora megakarya]|uniref:Uncharacterized protein n=1 Tax=Phytophthora megakarya TaxID=4795 RepID=A0A225VMD3_9STRA|nr:hypothetical protein PHMEG_00021144 [Phytophthora megakarya]
MHRAEAKAHVKHVLETWGDRDLERQLTPMQFTRYSHPWGYCSLHPEGSETIVKPLIKSKFIQA